MEKRDSLIESLERRLAQNSATETLFTIPLGTRVTRTGPALRAGVELGRLASASAS